MFDSKKWARGLVVFSFLVLASGTTQAQEVSGLVTEPTSSSSSADRQRYEDATVEMACNGVLIFRASEAKKREQANDKLLRKHGFTRASYMAMAFKFAGDGRVEREISGRKGRCPKPHPMDLLALKYSGPFNSYGLRGKMDVTLRQRKAKIVVEGTMDGENFAFNFTHEGSVSVNKSGSSGPYHWRVSGTLRQENFYGTMTVRKGQRRTRRGSFNLKPSM